MVHPRKAGASDALRYPRIRIVVAEAPGVRQPHSYWVGSYFADSQPD